MKKHQLSAGKHYSSQPDFAFDKHMRDQNYNYAYLKTEREDLRHAEHARVEIKADFWILDPKHLKQNTKFT